MEKREYNGWYNYETWLATLWFDNDEGTYRFFRGEAERILANTEGTEEERREEATETLADVIESQHAESIPEGLESGFFADLINAGLREVNYQEIAKHYVEEVEILAEETEEND